MNDFPLTGGCNCGAVRFEVTEPLVVASYCHCKRCQRRSGAAASASAYPAPGTFRIVAGEDRLRLWKPDDGGEKWFCGVCGSSLVGRNPDHADPLGIRMGAFDGSGRLQGGAVSTNLRPPGHLHPTEQLHPATGVSLARALQAHRARRRSRAFVR